MPRLVLGVLETLLGIFLAGTGVAEGPKASPESARVGHEVKDASSRGLMWVGIGMVVFAVVMHLSLSAAFRALKRGQGQPRASVDASLLEQRTAPPPPRLQVDPIADYRAYEIQQRRILSSYGWVDRPSGTARIPIDRAMETLAHGK